MTHAQGDDTPASPSAVTATGIPDDVTAGAPIYMNTPAADSPIFYLVVTVLALLLVGAMVFGAYITGFLAKLVPPETAASIYQSGVRFGLQVALNEAGRTKSLLDDEFFQEMAHQRGLQVISTRNPDGTFSYMVSQRGAG